VTTTTNAETYSWTLILEGLVKGAFIINIITDYLNKLLNNSEKII